MAKQKKGKAECDVLLTVIAKNVPHDKDAVDVEVVLKENLLEEGDAFLVAGALAKCALDEPTIGAVLIAGLEEFLSTAFGVADEVVVEKMEELVKEIAEEPASTVNRTRKDNRNLCS